MLLLVIPSPILHAGSSRQNKEDEVTAFGAFGLEGLSALDATP